MNEADIEQDPEIIHKLKESPQKLSLSRDLAQKQHVPHLIHDFCS